MNNRLIRITASIVFAVLLLASFFAYYFLSNRAEIIRTSTVELKNELIKLKEQQSNAESQKSKLDKQDRELQQKINKFVK